MALVVFAAAATCQARAAPQADPRARAAESYRQAQAAFARREYAAAASAFESAAALMPHPAALLDAADAWERAGDPARAAEDCDAARSLPNIGDASAADHVDYAADARACVTRARPRAALLDVRGEGVLSVRIDDGPERVLPLRQWLHAGYHVLVVRDLIAGASGLRRVEIEVSRGEEKALDVSAPQPAVATTLPAATTPAGAASSPAPPPATETVSATATRPPNPAPSPSTPGHHVPTASWVSFGVSAAATVGWGVLAALTWAAHDDFDGNPTHANAEIFYRDRALAYGAFAVAAVAAGVGVVLWLTSPRMPARGGLSPSGIVSF